MKFFEFEKRMVGNPVFTSNELKTIFFDQQNILVQVAFWVKKGYVKKVGKGLYLLAIEENNLDPVTLAGKIYSPSYLSLEFVLNYYGIIPDTPGTFTSVSTKKTMFFQNQFGNFSYQKIKNNLFTGYQSIAKGKSSINLATPEKALMDFLYLNKSRLIPESNFWKEMRVDEEFRFNKRIIDHLKKLFNDRKISALIDSLLKYQKDAR